MVKKLIAGTGAGLTIYGASDDLVEIEGIERGELAEGCTIEIGDPDTGGIAVTNRHDGKFGWTTTVRLLAVEEDDTPLPFPMRIELSETGYSLAVVIDCPAGTRVKATNSSGEEVSIS